MPQDAFTIKHTAKELNDKLVGAKIEKINQPDKDEVILFLHKNYDNFKLLLNTNADYARVCITENNKEAPIQAPNFCMLLRKHLLRATIQKIEAIPFERIIVITLACRDEIGTPSTKLLYCEIMGKYSNVTLVENGKILGAVKTTALSEDLARPIFPGVIYTLPTPQNKVDFSDINGAKEALKSFEGNDFVQFIFNSFKGVSIKTAREIACLYRAKSSADLSDIKNINIQDFILFFESFYNSPSFNPCCTFTPKNSDFFVTDYLSVLDDKKYFKSVNSAIDFFYSNKENAFRFSLKKSRLLDVIKAYKKKQEKKLQIVMEKLVDCSNLETYRLKGELIIAYIYKIKKGMQFVEVENYNEEDCPLVKISLDDKLTPEQNAERYFKQYNKKKKTIAAVTPQKTEIDELLNYCASVIMEIEKAENFDDFADIEEELRLFGLIKQPINTKKQKVKISKPRYYEYKGYEIFVGKNNIQNDRLTISADRNDLWLHTKDYHSAHVIIKNKGEDFPEDVILYAAEICAFFSNAKSSTKVPVDYTFKKFVKKPAGAKIGTVYYTNQKTILVDPKER